MKLPSTPGKSSVPLLISALISMPGLAKGQTIPVVHPEIVSAWKATAGDALLIFRHDGTYFQVQDSATEPGMERGTFTWDKTTSDFSATTIVDTNGEAGLSHPAGATTVTISGNTMTYTVAGEGSFTLSRVVNTASAIVGSWFIPGKHTNLTFLADGTYYHAEESNDAPDGYDGMERGTYTWNPSATTLTATPLADTNGWLGLSDPEPSFTATITGNSMSLFDGVETYSLRRITQIPTPLNTQIDFEVDKFSNYRQTSASAPTLLPGPPDDSPFWGEAYIKDSVPGTGGTLTIASQAPRSFVDDGGWWAIEEEYSTLVELNASSAFPNGANYVFARSGGSATLSYPAGGTFPPAPIIQGENGTWSGGEYVLDQNQTLTWAAHTNYDPAILVTVLSVVDRETSEEIMYETVIQGDITSYDFSGKLTPGSSYDVILEHVKIASSTTAGTGPFSGKLGYALYNSNTRFVMVAPDAPSASPTIIQHPQSQTLAPGDTASLTVGISEETSPSSTFQWYKNNQEIPGQTGNSLTYLNITSENYGNYKVRVSNIDGPVFSSIAVLGDGSAGALFDTFVAGFGLDPQTTGAPNLDYDKDGMANLLEFILGGNPVVPNPNLLPSLTTTPVAGGRNLVFTYKRKLAASSISQTIEHAADLSSTWAPAIHGQNGVTIATAPVDAETEQVTITIPATSSSHFVRLKATR